MRVTSIRIRNFRGIRDLYLELDEVTVLIGENNSGKTSVLDALRLCLKELGPRRVVFDTLDFHLPDGAADLLSVDPIQIEISFSEQTKGEWEDSLIGRLGRDGILQVGDDERSHVRLRVTCTFDSAGRDFQQEWSFLNLSDEPLVGVPDAALSRIQREVSYFYLHALREAGYHFGERGPFWRPFLKNTQLPAEEKANIEQKLKEVNDLVVSSHASFERARDGLRKVQDIVPLSSGDVVSIEAVPGRIFEMLAKAQIHLGTTTGAKIPVARHGEGTQSLAVLMLFSAFLEAWPNGAPVVALEEPEAHLHPSAIRALWKLVRDFTGQKLISTHSADLISEISIQDIVRLIRTEEGIKSFRVPHGLLSQEETRKFNYHVRQVRGELLFARCWLLVEGETEAWVYPAAARAIGADLHRDGVRIVEYRQSDVGLLAKIAKTLGIAWYCVGDDDAERLNTEPKVLENLGSASAEDRVVFPYPDIETHLLTNGYDDIYQRFMPVQNLAKIQKQADDPDYWSEYASNLPSRAKTRAAAEVAVELERRGEQGVTLEIRDVVDRVISLAGGA